MIKFETGKKYYGKEHKNYGKYISRDLTKVEIEVVKRSEKMVTILHNGEQNRKKIFIDSNGNDLVNKNEIRRNSKNLNMGIFVHISSSSY